MQNIWTEIYECTSLNVRHFISLQLMQYALLITDTALLRKYSAFSEHHCLHN